MTTPQIERVPAPPMGLHIADMQAAIGELRAAGRSIAAAGHGQTVDAAVREVDRVADRLAGWMDRLIQFDSSAFEAQEATK